MNAILPRPSGTLSRIEMRSRPAPVELLAPAGDLDKLKTAVLYGADAVYVGLPGFSLRAFCRNFAAENLTEAVSYAHEREVKVYAALNILARPEDITAIKQAIRLLGETGVDAVIVADPGVFALVREQLPQVDLHISSQASVTNARACLFWHQQGARRVILARELSLEDIKQIRSETPRELELEAFIHGAMCMAWSGRCLLSNHLTGRDSNRGRCAQPCRWSWQAEPVFEADPNTALPTDAGPSLILREDKQGSYIFNSRDLCMIEYLPQLIDAGLSSLKIEGRTKSSFYVATVVKAYRQALDRYQQDPSAYRFDPEWLEDLGKTVHRPFDTGFYFSRPDEDARVTPDGRMEHNAEVVGVVKAWLPARGAVLIEQRNRIESGAKLELVAPSGKHREVIAKPLFDLEWNEIECTPHAQMLYYLPVADRVVTGSFLRLTNTD